MNKLTTLLFIEVIKKELYDLNLVDRASDRILIGTHDRSIDKIYLKKNSLELLQSINIVIKSLKFSHHTSIIDLPILPATFQNWDELLIQIRKVFENSNFILTNNLASYELEKTQLKLF